MALMGDGVWLDADQLRELAGMLEQLDAVEDMKIDGTIKADLGGDTVEVPIAVDAADDDGRHRVGLKASGEQVYARG